MAQSDSRTYAGIFLLSTAALTYEIGLTRLFSLAQGYHFAFMMISIALLGIGAGGAVLMAWKWDKERDVSKTLARLAALFSIATIIAYVVANKFLFDPIKASWSKAEFFKIFLQYIILSLPFVISGMTISAAIRSISEKVHRIYFSDMAGAGTGCVFILLVLSRMDAEGAVVAAAALLIISSLLFRTPSNVREAMLPSLALVLLIIVTFGSKDILKVKISPYRDFTAALNFPGAKVVDTVFSPSGRMDIIDSPAVRAAPGISLHYSEPLPPQLGFTINGGGLTTVTSRAGEMSFLRHLPSSLVYRLKRGGDVFIVDPGGGMEVLSAMENEAGDIWGSETNSVVLRAMKGSFSGFSGRLYEDASIMYGYGRSVLKELDRSFDLIVLSRTDTLGASSSGIRGLHEDYSLTAQALDEYLNHLNEDGFISVSMYLLPPPRQELKILSTVIMALEDRGEGEVARRIMAIRSWGVMTLVVKKGYINDRDIKELKNFSRFEGFDLVWYPGMEAGEANLRNRFSEPIYHDRFRTVLDKSSREDFFRDYLFNISPVTDDRPFLGQTFKMTRMKETYESVGGKWGILIEGGYLLPWIFIQAVASGLVLIMIPLLFIKRTNVPTGVLLHTSAYFASIGVGFIFVEIALMQKFIPLLGEPVYAISAVLFSILVSSGAGSYLSGRMEIIERLGVGAILAVPILILAYLPLLAFLHEFMVGLGMIPKYILTFAFLFPLGAAMGMPFPAGMRLLGKKNASIIPWGWCINASFSVASSVLVMMVALAWGFTAALSIAAVVYVIAWLALRKLVSD